jgi:hypothetical protein
MVPMKKKVLQFPKPSASQSDAAIDEPHIVFSLGEVRLALQYSLIQINSKAAEAISIHNRSKRTTARSKRKSQ